MSTAIPASPIRRLSMSSATHVASPTVFIVDDDVSVRESLQGLIEEAGLHAGGFSSAEESLARPREPAPGVLVLDVSLPNLNGLELQKQIAGRPEPPIIFLTGRGDVPMTVQAMKAGADRKSTRL